MRGRTSWVEQAARGCARAILAWMVVGMGSLVLAGLAWARPVPVPFAGDYLSMVWGPEDGLPENSCSGIVPAADGSLWLGTFRGLARFNGSGVARYAPPGRPELARKGVVNLHRESGGRLWISTFGGLLSWENGEWREWGETNGWMAAGEQVRSYADRLGMPSVLTRFGGQVYRLEEGRFRELPKPEGTGGSWAALDDRGTVYVVRGGYAGYWKGTGWEPLELPPGLVGGGLAGAGQSRDGTALVVGRQALVRYREGRRVGQVPLSQPVSAFWQAFEDSQGALWLPSVTMGVYRVRPDGEVKWLRKADGLAHEGPTRAVYEDEQGGIWVGSGVGGVARLTEPRFRYAGEHEGLDESMIQGIAPLEDGEVLLGIYGVGPRVFDGSQTRALMSATMEEPMRRLRTVLRGTDGFLWMGAAASGLRRWDGTELRSVGTEVMAANRTLSTLFEDTEGRIWAGADNSVGFWDGRAFQEVVIPGRVSGEGAVYFAQHQQTIFLAHLNRIFRYTPWEGVQQGILLPDGVSVTGIVVDRTGRIWVGTNGQGLFGFAGGELRHWGMSEGLPSDGVGSMIMDDLDHLWFACGRMAVRAEPAHLWESVGSTSVGLRLRTFGETDGLRGLDFPIGTQPTVGKDAEGRLWFAQVRGAAMVDPAALTFRDRPPRVSIELLSYVPRGGRLPVEMVPGNGDLQLPPGIRQVEVHYTALDYAAPERHRFRVRLGGDRSEWQEMGSHRSVSFFEMPPGRHRLRVTAAGSDGVWNEEGAELVFVVAPFFWQTVWFQAGTALAVVGLAGVGGWVVSYRRWRSLKIQVAMRQLATSLTAALDAPALGRRVAETCRTLFHHDAFFLVLVDHQGAVQLMAHAEDTELGAVQPGAIDRGTGGPGTIPAAVVSGQALLLDGSGMGDQGEALFLSGGRQVSRVVSQMIAPIRWEGRTIGVVSVRSDTARRYHHRDLDQLQMLAAHCGAAIARMEAEVQVRENEERLRLAMETARMGSWEMDMETGALMASAEAEVVYGYARGTMSGDLAHLWSGALDREGEEVRQPLEAIRRGEASSLDVVHRIFIEGSERWLEVKGHVRRTVAAGSRPRLIGITADITERRQAERVRERLEAQLLQAQKQEAIGTLAGGIAHDFNNLLAVILGNVETAQLETDLDHPVRESLAEIQKSGLRARDLVRRILAFSRPQDHLHKVVPLEPIVQEVAQLLRATIPAGVEISVVAEGEAPAVVADPSQIHQVLLNLGTNAWHAMNEGRGQITFRLVGVTVDSGWAQSIPGLRPGRHALLQVIDDGQGMSGEVQSRIFDPFFTTKPPGKGTGLGLPMALGIVKSHGGVLTVESAVGRGSTFSLYFPGAESEVVAEPMATTVVAPEQPPTGARILFVDDEEGLVRLVRRVLENAGYGVEVFTEAQKARRRFLEDPGYFDAVISDLSMPGLSGLELAREVLRVRPQMAMMLCSGNLSEGEASEAGVLGVRALLSKPFSSGEFLRAVSGMLADRPAHGGRG